jgi:glycine cleavage system protein P-like pyridoxal-binding family
LFYKALAFVIIPFWLIIGFCSVGILWPPQVREWLFVQKETAVSRAEIERRKLEQLREIQTDMKNLKNEIRKEMSNDREEMFRLKAEVEAVQGEVLSDLQQVKELMTTLLDLGGIAMDR